MVLEPRLLLFDKNALVYTLQFDGYKYTLKEGERETPGAAVTIFRQNIFGLNRPNGRPSASMQTAYACCTEAIVRTYADLTYIICILLLALIDKGNMCLGRYVYSTGVPSMILSGVPSTISLNCSKNSIRSSSRDSNRISNTDCIRVPLGLPLEFF